MIYHISKNGSDRNSGSEACPFLTVNKAAGIAVAGDTVIVHEGTYRERICPVNSGLNGAIRITYKAADGERVIIKGSEVVDGWVKKDGIWSAEIENTLFTEANPFETTIDGDWIELKEGEQSSHTAAVYIDGEALSEVYSKEAVSVSAMTWFAEVDETATTVYANFGDTSPDSALVELNVRSYLFAPMNAGVNYITVSGFEFAHAATNWAPPTASQGGAVWARWCKGWIIENNVIHHSRCSGISLGRDGMLGHNPTLSLHRKPGFRNELELVFRSQKCGWTKGNIGSHIVRGNTIYECGQTGIVGHMGGAFSEIYRNHIYRIGLHGFRGAEIAGIKLHAAIDTYIHHNRIHNTMRGMWLDWQAQGVRVSSNVIYSSKVEDLFAEVTHGPLTVDNNIFASPFSVHLQAQGSAFINNIFCGKFVRSRELLRYTPYHMPHSTDIMGCTKVYGGDDRIYNNVFLLTGTDIYNGLCSSFEEYDKMVLDSLADSGAFTMVGFYVFADNEQPAYVGGNLYSESAKPFDKEKENTTVSNISFNLTEENDGVYAELCIAENVPPVDIINTHDLRPTIISEGLFESPSGENICIDTDITGIKRVNRSMPGAIESYNTKVKVF